jgi:hypothetical protein
MTPTAIDISEPPPAYTSTAPHQSHTSYHLLAKDDTELYERVINERIHPYVLHDRLRRARRRKLWFCTAFAMALLLLLAIVITGAVYHFRQN